MRDEVLEFLRQNQGSFVSGQDMSEAMFRAQLFGNISRRYVKKATKLNLIPREGIDYWKNLIC